MLPLCWLKSLVHLACTRVAAPRSAASENDSYIVASVLCGCLLHSGLLPYLHGSGAWLSS